MENKNPMSMPLIIKPWTFIVDITIRVVVFPAIAIPFAIPPIALVAPNKFSVIDNLAKFAKSMKFAIFKHSFIEIGFAFRTQAIEDIDPIAMYFVIFPGSIINIPIVKFAINTSYSFEFLELLVWKRLSLKNWLSTWVPFSKLGIYSDMSPLAYLETLLLLTRMVLKLPSTCECKLSDRMLPRLLLIYNILFSSNHSHSSSQWHISKDKISLIFMLVL